MTNSELHDRQHPAFAPAKINYFLLLASVLTGVTAIIALIVAYVYRDDSPDWLRSHYDFQIRTFWIGCLYMIVGVLTSFILVGVVVLIVATIWLIVRCVKGIKTLDQQLSHPDSRSWWM